MLGYKNVFLVIIVLALTAGCGGPALLDSSLYVLRKGMSIEPVEKAIDSDIFYKFAGNGYYDLTDRGLTGYGKIGVMFRMNMINGITQYSIFAFRDEKLIYWGTPAEFAKSDDELLQKIGRMANEIIKSEM